MQTFNSPRRSVEVYDTDSGMGGSFNVEIVEELDAETVKVKVWYGRPTPNGWECWPEWDGFRMTVRRDKLHNKRTMKLYRE